MSLFCFRIDENLLIPGNWIFFFFLKFCITETSLTQNNSQEGKQSHSILTCFTLILLELPMNLNPIFFLANMK